MSDIEKRTFTDTLINDGKPDFLVQYDTPEAIQATRVRIEINLDKFCMDSNTRTQMRQALEEVKFDLLAILQIKSKQATANGKILMPSQARPQFEVC